jgi:hypothetical protein
VKGSIPGPGWGTGLDMDMEGEISEGTNPPYSFRNSMDIHTGIFFCVYTCVAILYKHSTPKVLHLPID